MIPEAVQGLQELDQARQHAARARVFGEKRSP
jgi:hypothetical protein